MQEKVDWKLAAPISISEVAASIKKTKNSAPGPDNYRLRKILAKPVEQLTILFNTMLLYGPGRLLEGVFDSKVRFIKKTRTPSSPLDYQPIAVGNFITRIFLSHSRQNDRQF